MLRRLRGGPQAPGRWAPSIVFGLILCASPLWLWAAPIRWYFLKSDDFVYIARSRTPAALRKYLLKPHNGHVVPLFRLETHALARLAGSLEAMPPVLGWASYATLILAMAAAGHVVGRETGGAALGLAAMAAVGLTSVLGPTLLWYAAGQALMAGTMVLAMLAALQAWRIGGAWWTMALAVLAAMAAPLFWSGGYVAGPVGFAYLWADGRREARRTAAALALTSMAVLAIVWLAAGHEFAPRKHLATQPLRDVLPVGAMVAHTSQAICEALILNNLGLDAATTGRQAILLCAILAAVWCRSRGRIGPDGMRSWPRLNPMEAAGAALVVTTFGLIFSARGIEGDFEDLRALGWYDAMAELGAVLFACGWFAGEIPSPPPASLSPPGRREWLGLGLFAAVMLTLQAPRADRLVFEYDEMAAPMGPISPGPVELRTPADLAAQARTQRQALAALDGLESSARRSGLDRAAIQRAVDAVAVPGMPTHLLDFKPEQLLDIPANPLHPPDPGGDRR